MNKSTNNFRRCQFCPHHQQKKQCCCQNRKSIISVKTKNNSRNKSRNKKKKLNDQSTISYINSTLPITNNPVFPHFSSNILAQNSVLRTQNDYLKRQLHSQYYNVSAFMKDDRNVSTLPTSENQTSRTFQLHDKLYLSNRNLQEALIQLDTLSKANKQLHEINTKISLQKQQLYIKNQQLFEETQRLKKKIKKFSKIIQDQPKQFEIQKIVQLNIHLEQQNTFMQQQIQQLKQQLKRNQSRGMIQIQNLSPQWVAHTSTKINALQRNISRLQQQNKQNISNNQSSFLWKQSTKSFEQQSSLIKKQLISTIKLLKIQSHSFKLTSAFDEILYNSNTSIMLLIKGLCEALVEPIQMYYLQIQKQIDRSLKIYESKFRKVVQRLQNMVIKVQNDQLKEINKQHHYF